MPIDIENEHVKDRLARLRAVRWSSAPGASQRAKDLFYAYYDRLLPIWPASEEKLVPDSGTVLSAFFGRLLAGEMAEIETLGQSVAAAARARKQSLGRMTVSLVKLILACAVLRGRAELDAASDPSEPLLELFEAGYELSLTHGAVDLMDANGMVTIRLPTRASTEARRAAALMQRR